jgi:hypothetical protein
VANSKTGHPEIVEHHRIGLVGALRIKNPKIASHDCFYEIEKQFPPRRHPIITPQFPVHNANPEENFCSCAALQAAMTS